MLMSTPVCECMSDVNEEGVVGALRERPCAGGECKRVCAGVMICVVLGVGRACSER